MGVSFCEEMKCGSKSPGFFRVFFSQVGPGLIFSHTKTPVFLGGGFGFNVFIGAVCTRIS